ncbi:MAG: hypothetical protein M1815_003149 [Lichina confinis]|nr:MAG: hypothetical protein M1815_003149 [Lichina confinis]
MSDKKIVVVFGATGVQGGSVVKALLNDPETATKFHIRGVTRDPSKPNAKVLAEKGVECVKGDLDSKDSLREAFKNAYAVYAVTNYWESMSADKEIQQGKNVVDVAKESGVQHLVFSTLLNVTEITNGKLPHVYHFDSKAEIEKYMRSTGIGFTAFMPGFYMSNFPTMIMVPNTESNDKDALLFVFPTPSDSTKIPLFDADADTGKYVKAILKKPDQTLGKRVFAATDYYTPDQMLDTFRQVKPSAGKLIRFAQVSPDQFKQGAIGKGMPEFAAQELLENFQLLDAEGYFGGADLGESLALLDEKPSTWKEYVENFPQWAHLD